MGQFQEITQHAISNASYLQIFLGIYITFGLFYFGLAFLTLRFTRDWLPKAGIGRLIDGRPLKPGQMKREMKNSLVSIGIFALYGVLTIALERKEWLVIQWEFGFWDFVIDLLVIALWNELHFYACHALLHRKWLYRRIHREHHRSAIPTPFSTFSFHWIEAVMLSSVMILLMPFRHLNIGVILFFPVASLIYNNIGHMNYAVFPQHRLGSFFSSCRRHTMHHTRIRGNYGFVLPWFDFLFKTRARNVDYDAPLEDLPEA
tara:strand:- start:8353 stop:9132 length:780 start_codon:yes stop_codon:yes gene_type:complete